MKIASFLLAWAIVAPTIAEAANLIVVEARGIALRAGQTVDSTKPFALKEGQHVTLVSPTGSTFKLDGPYNKAPDADAGQSVNVGAMLAALRTTGARIGEVGTTRGLPPYELPDPWVLDATRTGIVCLQDGGTAVLWRSSTAAQATVSVMPADRSWKADANWPAGADRITMTTQVPMHAGATYLVLVNGSQYALTVAAVPAVLANDEMRAAWMAEKGCEAQAEALLRR